MIAGEYILPYVITNLVAIGLLIVSIKWFETGKYLFGLIFLAASVFNIITAFKSPESYLQYGETAKLFFYRNFINTEFKAKIVLYVLIIAGFQLFFAFCLFSGIYIEKYGFIGGIIFLLLIAPLGIGSAFPSTIIMALALYIIYFKTTKRIKNKIRSRP